MDETEMALMQMIKDRVNNVDSHRIDEKALLGQIQNLISGIGGIEELAMEVEEGKFELDRDPSPYECAICQGSKCRC